MTRHDFAYQAILRDDDPTTITSMIAYQAPAERNLRAVLWSVPRQAWIYAPKIAAGLLYDDQERNRVRPLDRMSAELVSRETFQVDLPTEETLARMCEEGELMGWSYGPPRL